MVRNQLSCLLFAALVASSAGAKEDAAWGHRIAATALTQVGVTVGHDPAYRKLAYPNGDVPANTGVCADVVVRAFRAGGVDLQQKIHEDMAASFTAYPQKWGLRGPDTNIDHRRVLNLMKFFERKGAALIPPGQPSDYQPGDVVAWKLSNGLHHIGVVSTTRASDAARLLVVHNIGRGAHEEDVLVAWQVIGHYRYAPADR
jgi:hypothetical protein